MNPITAISAISKEAIVEKFKETLESSVKESPLTSSLETIENTTLEALEAQNLELLEDFKNKIKSEAFGNKITGEPVVKEFPEGITFDDKEILYKGKPFARIDTESKTIYIDRRAGLDGKGLNQFLAHPKYVENYTYHITDGKNTHIIKINSSGNTESGEHIVKEIDSKRFPNEQTKAKMFGDEEGNLNTPKSLKDEGGHNLATSAGGIPESINIMPQAYKVNHSAEWRGMETKIKNGVEANKEVKVEWKKQYPEGSKRPESYSYKVTIDGESTEYQFNNKNSY